MIRTTCNSRNRGVAVAYADRDGRSVGLTQRVSAQACLSRAGDWSLHGAL